MERGIGMMVRTLLAVSVAFGIIALAVAALLSFGSPARADHVGPAAHAMAIDMDPSLSPANTATTIGSVEACARINENDTLDADEGAVDTLNIDVIVDTIPASNPAITTSFEFHFPTPNVTLTPTATPFGSFYGWGFNASDGPQSDGTYFHNFVDLSATGDAGSGVMGSFTFVTAPGVATGAFPLSLVAPVHIDTTGTARVPANAVDSDGDTFPDVQGATVAINTDCPLPETDISMDSVSILFLDTSNAAITEIGTSTDFKIQATANGTNLGPANADVLFTLPLTLPPDCSTTSTNPATGFLGDRPPGAISTTKFFTVNCTDSSSHQFDMDAYVEVVGLASETNFANNDPVNGNNTIPVNGEANVEIVNMTLTAPPTAFTGSNFDVDVDFDLQNGGPVDPVDVDVTVGLFVPADCTKSPVGDQSENGFTVNGTTPIPTKTWVVSCSSTGPHALSAPAGAVVVSQHTSDPDGAAELAVASVTLEAPPTNADLKVNSATVNSPAGNQAAGSAFDVLATATIHNNGPDSNVDSSVTWTLNLPGDCTAVGGAEKVSNHSLAMSSALVVDPGSAWSVTCTDPSFHSFTVTAAITPAATGDTPSNNEVTSAVDVTPIIGSADVKVTSVSVTAPATVAVGSPFNVTGDIGVHNNGPVSSAFVDGSLTLNLPAGCTTGSANPDTLSGDLPQSVPLNFQSVWSVTCDTIGAKDFTATGSLTVNDLHVSDPNTANNSQESSPDSTTITSATDLKVNSVTVFAPTTWGVDIIDGSFGVTATANVHNNGPETPVDAQVVFTLTGLPTDCNASPAQLTVDVSGLAQSASAVVDVANANETNEWTVSCTLHSNHQFTAEATISVTSANVTDSNNGNDTASGNDTTAITAQTDAKVTGSLADAPDTAAVGAPFTVGGQILRHNNGPIADYAVDYEITLNLPAGCTTGSLNPRTVSLASGPISVTQPLGVSWSATCSTIGPKDFSTSASVAITEQHVTDSTLGNNSFGPGAVDTINILGAADLKVNSVTVTSPASVQAGTPFSVNVVTGKHNNGPEVAKLILTVELQLPSDCTTSDNLVGGVSGTLGVSVTSTTNLDFVGITCSDPSNHQFNAIASIALDDPSLSDPNTTNNGPVNGSDTTAITAEADVKMTSVSQIVPGTAAAGQAFDVTALTAFHNNGPVTPATTDISIALNLPPGCSTSDLNPVIGTLDLAVSVSTGGSPVWSVTCDTLGAKDFTVTASATLNQLHVSDPNTGNDSQTSSLDSTNITGAADLKVTGVTVTAPASVQAGSPFSVDVSATVHNNGPQVTDGEVAFNLPMPPDCFPAVTSELTNTVSFFDLAVGANLTLSSPLSLSILCTGPSNHIFTGTASVVVTSPDISDPTPGTRTATPATTATATPRRRLYLQRRT